MGKPPPNPDITPQARPLNVSTLSSPQDACKVLNVQPCSSWESIKKARRKIVKLANPDRLEMRQSQKRLQAFLDAKNANAAYALLLNLRMNNS